MHAYFNNIRDDMPTASAAHDTFWDYVANNPEGLHQVLWIMSDYGIVRSYRMMPAWSINTYLFVNAEGVSTFVRFVWKPVLGTHALLQDEAQKIGGIDPDYHRRDLREAIDRGAYPKYELGIQLIEKEKVDIDKFVRVAYEHYKPIGIGMTAQSYIPTIGTNNIAGIVSAKYAANFGQDFVTAVAEQRIFG